MPSEQDREIRREKVTTVNSSYRTLLFTLPLAVLTVLAAGIIATAQTTAATDLRVLFQQQNDAQNRGDVAGVMATYAEDASVRGGFLCTPAPCVGKAAIQAEVERRIAQKAQVEVLSLRESSGTATGVLQVTEAGFASCGVQRILVNFTFVVKNDKMSTWTSAPDPNDAQSSRYLACIAARMAAGGAPGGPAISPPSAGDGGLRAAGAGFGVGR
jgi:hypothetical protein